MNDRFDVIVVGTGFGGATAAARLAEGGARVRCSRCKHAFFLPVVDSSYCTGCGKCESACIIQEAAIKVLPLDVAKGELGEHYRFGWTEEARISRDFQAPRKAPDVPAWGEQGLRKVLESMNDLSGIEEP